MKKSICCIFILLIFSSAFSLPKSQTGSKAPSEPFTLVYEKELNFDFWNERNLKQNETSIMSTPIIINEYVDLARSFYDGAEVKIANAVLDKIAKVIRE